MTKPVIARNQKDDQRASLDAAARRWREQPAEDRAALIEDMANEVRDNRAVAASVADEDPDRAKGLRRGARVIAAALAIIKAAGGARP